MLAKTTKLNEDKNAIQADKTQAQHFRIQMPSMNVMCKGSTHIKVPQRQPQT